LKPSNTKPSDGCTAIETSFWSRAQLDKLNNKNPPTTRATMLNHFPLMGYSWVNDSWIYAISLNWDARIGEIRQFSKRQVKKQ
jgi:hypothetical protein